MAAVSDAPSITPKEFEEMGEREREDMIVKLREYSTTLVENIHDVEFEYIAKLLKSWGIALVEYAVEKGIEKMRSSSVMPKMVFAVMYNAVFKYASFRDGHDMLEDLHTSVVQRYLRENVLPALEAKHDDGLLREFKRRWEGHKLYAEWMRKLFLPIDRIDTNPGAADSKDSTTSVALRLFKDEVFDRKKRDVVRSIQELIDRDRMGESVDLGLIRSVVELFLVMGITMEETRIKDRDEVERLARDKRTGTNETYITDFEAPFIENSRTTFLAQTEMWIESDNVSGYLHKVEAELIKAKGRVEAYLNPATWPKLRSVLINVMVRDRAPFLLDDRSGLVFLIAERKDEDVGRLFRMFKLFPGGLQKMKTVIGRMVSTMGGELLRKRRVRVERAGADGRRLAGDDAEFIEDLIELQTRFVTLVEERCANHLEFRKELSSALNTIVNSHAMGEGDPHPTAELLATFVDGVMRGRRKGARVDAAGMSKAIKEVHSIFLLVNDKDLFQNSHRTLLAKRLLSGTSVDNAIEVEFIARLKETEGPSYTGKFEGMLADLKSDDALVKSFVKTSEAARGVGFSARVLCKGHWPAAFPTKSVSLPPVIRGVADGFAAAFRDSQRSRKLEYALADGTMELAGHFVRPKTREAHTIFLRCGTLQGLLLLQFNEASSWTVSSLARAAGLEPANACSLLRPLVFKDRVLIDRTLADDHKAGKKITKKIEPGHTLEFNPKFDKKARLITVPPVVLKETFSKAAIDIGRRHIMDAAIVRVMKARKELKHHELVSQVQMQVRRLFAADPAKVKERIESLIEQDYMTRDEKDSRLLHYVA